MMTIIVAGVSFLCGLAIPHIGSIVFVLLAAVVLTVAVIVLALGFNVGLGAAILAWLASAVAMQFGYAVALGIRARHRARGAGPLGGQDMAAGAPAPVGSPEPYEPLRRSVASDVQAQAQSTSNQ